MSYNKTMKMKILVLILVLMIGVIFFIRLGGMQFDIGNLNFFGYKTNQHTVIKLLTFTNNPDFSFEYPVFDGWKTEVYDNGIIYKLETESFLKIPKMQIEIDLIDFREKPEWYTFNKFGVGYDLEYTSVEFDNGKGSGVVLSGTLHSSTDTLPLNIIMETIASTVQITTSIQNNFTGEILFFKEWFAGEDLDIKDTIITKLKLKENLIGTLEADGYQTYKRYAIKGILKGPNSIDIFYESLSDEDSMDLYQKGDYLFSIDIVDGKYLYRNNHNFNELNTGDIGEFTSAKKK